MQFLGIRSGEGDFVGGRVRDQTEERERLFAFRALHFARGDAAPLPGMDQELWAQASNAHEQPLSELVEQFSAARSSSLALYRSFSPEELERTGVASGCCFTVRAVAFILAGHEIHHRGVLAERYLK